MCASLRTKPVLLGIGPALVVLGVLGVCGAAFGDVRYVRADAVGANTGDSWADAYTDLQAALAAAGVGDEIWVAAGTYSPAPRPVSPENANRDVAFAMRSGVALFGGFAGTETSRDLRDPEANPTILSGDLFGDDTDDFTNSTENSYQVVVAVDVDATGILDGFTIRAGYADGVSLGAVPESKDQGSGINIYNGGPIIRHCIVEHNYSGNHGSLNDHGDTTRVEHCVFRHNFSVGFGAGLYLHNHSQTSVSDCVFEFNTASAEGGGMYSRSMTGAMVRDCYFRENTAVLGAGFYNAEASSAHIDSCTFFGNFAVNGGGGVYSDRTGVAISNCLFVENSAGVDEDGGGAGSGGSGGGGVWFSGGTNTLLNCVFSNNAASFGGGVYNIDLAEATIQGCLFIRNFAREAGGVYALSSPVRIRQCTFLGNRAFDGVFPVGGAVSNYFSDSVVSDCTFLGNASALGGGAIYNEGEHPVIERCSIRFNSAQGQEGRHGWGGAILNSYNTAAVISNCDIFQNSALVGGGIFNLIFSSPTITNCTILDNHSTGTLAGDPSGGIYSYTNSHPVVRNCIVYGNTPAQFAGAAIIDVSHSCVQDGFAGVGITSRSPALVRLPSPGIDEVWNTPDDDAGDLRPAPGSVCIDAGDNNAVGVGETDLAAAPRRHDDTGMPDRGVGTAPVVDLGAYESIATTCRGDFNASGAVNSQDFFDFLAALFSGQPDGDFNFDAFANSQDFFDFVAAFFAPC